MSSSCIPSHSVLSFRLHTCTIPFFLNYSVITFEYHHLSLSLSLSISLSLSLTLNLFICALILSISPTILLTYCIMQSHPNQSQPITLTIPFYSTYTILPHINSYYLPQTIFNYTYILLFYSFYIFCILYLLLYPSIA